MNVSELSFDEFESGGENLELVNEFFECVEEPVIPTSRVYKGKGGKHYTAYEFGLCEGVTHSYTHTYLTILITHTEYLNRF